jgi:hypothetical protein
MYKFSKVSESSFRFGHADLPLRVSFGLAVGDFLRDRAEVEKRISPLRSSQGRELLRSK